MSAISFSNATLALPTDSRMDFYQKPMVRLLRTICLLIIRVLYKIKVRGVSNIPKDSGALIVANHVSFLDALLIVAATPRLVRFVTHEKIYLHPLLNWLFRSLHMIPVRQGTDKESLNDFYVACADEIRAGYIVCIFAEGQVSRNGQLLKFKRGLEKIAHLGKAPIIPICLDNVIGSPFSFPVNREPGNKKLLSRRLITVSIGKPLSYAAKSFEVRQKVLELQAEAFDMRIQHGNTLGLSFVKTAKKYLDHPFIADDLQKPITYKEALWHVTNMAKTYEHIPGRLVGVCLPDQSWLTLVNIALNMAGKTVINLPQNLNMEDWRVIQEEYNMMTLIHDDAEFFNHSTFSNLLLIDITSGEGQSVINKYLIGLAGRVLPAKWFCKLFLPNGQPSQEDDACMAMQKASDGSITMIPISHAQVLSSIEAISQIYDFGAKDTLLGSLSKSTIQGYLIDLWFPALKGMTVVHNSRPTNSSWINNMIKQHKVNILLGHWLEKGNLLLKLSKAQLSQLKYILSYSGQISEQVKNYLHEYFSVKVKECFGLPGCLPVIAMNALDFEGKDISGKSLLQEGSMEEKAGRAIPGIAIKVVNPANPAHELTANESGMILVKGSNVIGNLFSDVSQCLSSFYKGWYITGVIGSISEDGFLTLNS